MPTYRPQSFNLLIAATLFILICLPARARCAAPVVVLAADGKANVGIVTAAGASPRVKVAARNLAAYLQKITGAAFDVADGDGKSGIAVGLFSDFKFPLQAVPFDRNRSTRREDYFLQSHAGGLYVGGATDLAVEHAVWDLLYRIGYRQYFEGEHWEIIPHVRDLSIAVDVEEHPSYFARSIWFGFGTWDYGAKPYADWCAKNRITSGIQLNTGHSYEGILHEYRDVFAAHPEYLALVSGKRQGPKFCTANLELRKLVVRHAMEKLAKDPTLDSVSCDPSDGGGWCECDQCAKLGSVSDRALLLANDVARAVNEKYPGKLVGMYAYAYHSPPPNIKADPNVVISVATAFIHGGMTLDEIMAGWSAKTSTLGIREYYEVHPWDRDLPAAARGGNIQYLASTIPTFYSKGARFLSAESGQSFGPDGLGYYLAARMMWDVREAGKVSALVDDFLTRCFGPAKEPMASFYRELDGSETHLVRANQIGQMFRSVEAARKLTDAPDIRARLDDLLIYCRYVDLYYRYADAKDAARQQAFEALIRHAYRTRLTMMMHVLALYRDLSHRDHTVHIPPEAEWNVPEAKNPWKSSEPVGADELSRYLAEGIERYPLTKIDFEPKAFSDELIPATRLKLPDVTAGSLGAGRGKQIFYTYVEAAPATIDVAITGGMIAGYRDRGNVKLALWKIGGASQTGQRETLVAEDKSTPPDGKEHPLSLKAPEAGLYRLTLEDGQDRTLLKWKSPLPFTIKSTIDEPMNKLYGDLWHLYFYVPKGTKTLGLFGGEHGEVHDSHQRAVFWLNGRAPNYYSVNVPDGEDGKLWSIVYGRGAVRLLTVPPCFAPSSGQLLLPREVVEKDSAK